MLKSRIWELDFARGTALVLMVYFHTIYDLKEIFNYNITYESGINYILGKFSAIVFIAVSGVSSLFSKNNTIRGARIFGLGLLITVGTWLYDPKLYVKFGILHFLGICTMLAPLLKKAGPAMLAVLGACMLIAGVCVQNITISHNYLFWLGLCTPDFTSADYYPLIPWLGAYIPGIAAGKLIYSSGKSLFRRTLPDTIVNSMGRHTLSVYLLHQPLIIGVLAAFNKIFHMFL